MRYEMRTIRFPVFAFKRRRLGTFLLRLGASKGGVQASVYRIGNQRKERIAEEYRMIGNAVPPLLARALGDKFLEANFTL